MDIRFKSPYVNDGFEWNLKGKPKKGYKVINGSKSLQTDFVSDGRTKKDIRTQKQKRLFKPKKTFMYEIVNR